MPDPSSRNVTLTTVAAPAVTVVVAVTVVGPVRVLPAAGAVRQSCTVLAPALLVVQVGPAAWAGGACARAEASTTSRARIALDRRGRPVTPAPLGLRLRSRSLAPPAKRRRGGPGRPGWSAVPGEPAAPGERFAPRLAGSVEHRSRRRPAAGAS